MFISIGVNTVVYIMYEIDQEKINPFLDAKFSDHSGSFALSELINRDTNKTLINCTTFHLNPCSTTNNSYERCARSNYTATRHELLENKTPLDTSGLIFEAYNVFTLTTDTAHKITAEISKANRGQPQPSPSNALERTRTHIIIGRVFFLRVQLRSKTVKTIPLLPLAPLTKSGLTPGVPLYGGQRLANYHLLTTAKAKSHVSSDDDCTRARAKIIWVEKVQPQEQRNGNNLIQLPILLHRASHTHTHTAHVFCSNLHT